MAKAPVPGKVKTRLINSLGVSHATVIYRQLLTTTLLRLSAVQGCKVLSCDPHSLHEVFRRLGNRGDWQRRAQPRGDLGKRMSGIVSMYQHRYPYTLIVGSDLANIDARYVERCVQRLVGGHDLVLGATSDGGYGLIGMSRLHAELFRAIPWSTDRVLQITLARARRLKLKTAVMPGLWDVDNWRDYRRYHQEKAWVV
jgi:rSAM/selenodomain-associated transferase 1